ncbi:ABATE domain-containing protein [uncultured Streptomyces sp.]|uniref:CGNR zinc finger domain-containing protein n=1 Tax=uncultured Streptomyces sp. TaxID=174707 RepID=UPI00260D2845|nr:CGNR zinc finger domain-containing protein [uncultured Streptomyces sp.]
MESGAEPSAALALVNTVRHDGAGGVTDDLATVGGTAEWLDGLPGPLAGDSATDAALVVDDRLRQDIVALRQAVRALFARALAPGPASPADAGRLMPADRALELLNAAAARTPVVPRLDWPDGPDAVPVVRTLSAKHGDPGARTVAALARAAVDFLAGPERARLRACTAPRCVRYFVKSHGRQEWCKTSCGNRARAARHYRLHHGPADADRVDGTDRADGAGTGPRSPATATPPPPDCPHAGPVVSE